MKINVGIVGYGNLGKAAEQLVLSKKNLNLVAIFSRRVVVSRFGTLVEPYENFGSYKNKIDVMLLCGGSKSDLEVQTPEILECFDCINTFDTHKKIVQEHNKLSEIAAQSGHRLIMSCGWDPGLFSVIRALGFAISGEEPITFWGKGISMGHSDAIRRVEGVVDGVQFTVPNKEALALAKKGKRIENVALHNRECFVVADEKNQQKIEREIKNIPNYFKGQPTVVNFVSSIALAKLKAKMCHKGEVLCNFTSNGTKNNIGFSVAMDSNPNFTASIMVAYIAAIINLKAQDKSGAFTCLDIPVSDLFLGDTKQNLLERFC